MDTNAILEYYKSLVIQIATPYSTGTGFYVSEHDIIITNEHVIRDNKEVVINGAGFSKQIVQVVYIDQKYDLAFLQVPDNHEMPKTTLEDEDAKYAEGDEILAIGHPFGLKYTATKGIISNTVHNLDGIRYLQHDAALNPGNSGGPLIAKTGNILGVNTFVIKNGNNIGFSLPIKYLKETISEWEVQKGISGVRCTSCLHIVFENTVEGKYCHHCGSGITMISKIDAYEPTGICRAIEEIFTELSYDVPLSRMGPSNWTIRHGSARVNFSYHEKSGLITGDAYLCKLPENRIDEIYLYLLKENNKLEGLTLSVRGEDVILSLLIFDQYMDKEVTKLLIQHLLESADIHDTYLIEEYDALAIENFIE